MKLIIFLWIVLSSGSGFAQKDTVKESFLISLKIETQPVYIKASNDIAVLREHVNLAKQNLMPKNKVVSSYNELVGATMGKLISFDAVDKKLQKAGDAYITFLFDKEIARLAKQKARQLK